MIEAETDVSAGDNPHMPEPANARPAKGPSSVSEAAGDFFEAAHNKLLAIRKHVLKVMPAFVINNASNCISLVHLVGETWMLKSGGLVFMQNHRDGGKVHPVIDPVNNLKRAVTGEDQFDRKGGAQQNHWQVLATTTGLTNWTMGALVPEGRDSQEQIDHMVELSKEHPLKYLFNRAVEGCCFFNPKYKRQTIGLGVTATGICSFLSGFHNVNSHTHSNFKNLPHSLNGLLTLAAGLQLWFSADREDAWSRYGATMSMRMFVLPFTIHEKKKHFDGNWGYYTAGATALQSASLLSYFIGGAEKRKDGSIVDHKAEAAEARQKYGKHHHATTFHQSTNGFHKSHPELPAPVADTDTDKPSATVSQVTAHDAGIAAQSVRSALGQ